MTDEIHWTMRDQHIAKNEGWGLFHFIRMNENDMTHDEEGIQIQRRDDVADYATHPITDEQARLICEVMAEHYHSSTHQKAIAVVITSKLLGNHDFFCDWTY